MPRIFRFFDSSIDASIDLFLKDEARHRGFIQSAWGKTFPRFLGAPNDRGGSVWGWANEKSNALALRRPVMLMAPRLASSKRRWHLLLANASLAFVLNAPRRGFLRSRTSRPFRGFPHHFSSSHSKVLPSCEFCWLRINWAQAQVCTPLFGVVTVSILGTSADKCKEFETCEPRSWTHVSCFGEFS